MVVVCGHCLLTLFLPFNQTFKMAFVAAHLNAGHSGGDIIAIGIYKGWNGYRNKRQHRKLTLEKKILPRRLMQGLEPATFQSRAWRSNHRAISSVTFAESLTCKTGSNITWRHSRKYRARPSRVKTVIIFPVYIFFFFFSSFFF